MDIPARLDIPAKMVIRAKIMSSCGRGDNGPNERLSLIDGLKKGSRTDIYPNIYPNMYRKELSAGLIFSSEFFPKNFGVTSFLKKMRFPQLIPRGVSKKCAFLRIFEKMRDFCHIFSKSWAKLHAKLFNNNEVINFPDMLKYIETNQILKAQIKQNQILYNLKNITPNHKSTFFTPEIAHSLIQKLIHQNIPFSFQPTNFWGRISKHAWFWVPLTMASFTAYSALNPDSDAGKLHMNDFSDGSSAPVSFASVKGIDVAKSEISEIVDMIRSPAKYQEMGARTPRGVLLVGPPGMGKTLLAKALANEADLPFVYANGSDFVEVYAGRGASRIRSIFEKARNLSPSIIFIDEIDAIGKKRAGGKWGASHQESHEEEYVQTLNALLASIDGLDTKGGDVLVMAATNRFSVLDPALTRPGRFDRLVNLSLPDLNGRLAILEHYAERSGKMGEGVNLGDIAEDGEGLSPSDLELIINEACIAAVRNERLFVSQSDLNFSLTKILTRENTPPDPDAYDFTEKSDKS